MWSVEPASHRAELIDECTGTTVAGGSPAAAVAAARLLFAGTMHYYFLPVINLTQCTFSLSDP